MLRVDMGAVEIRGKKIDLMAEFTQLVNHLIKIGAFTEEDITLCIDTAKMSEEEIQDEVGKRLKEVFSDDDDMVKILGDLFGVK